MVNIMAEGHNGERYNEILIDNAHFGNKVSIDLINDVHLFFRFVSLNVLNILIFSLKGLIYVGHIIKPSKVNIK